MSQWFLVNQNRHDTHIYLPIISLILLSGLEKSDAMFVPRCTKRNTICKCMSSTFCKPGRYVYSDSSFSNADFLPLYSKEKNWCHLHYVQNPALPSQNCYIDTKWSPTWGVFISKEACTAFLKQNGTQNQAQSASRGKLF